MVPSVKNLRSRKDHIFRMQTRIRGQSVQIRPNATEQRASDPWNTLDNDPTTFRPTGIDLQYVDRGLGFQGYRSDFEADLISDCHLIPCRVTSSRSSFALRLTSNQRPVLLSVVETTFALICWCRWLERRRHANRCDNLQCHVLLRCSSRTRLFVDGNIAGDEH